MASLVGRRLGRYQMQALLGKGGMAEVFQALDTTLGRAVAVKVILPAYASQPEFVERFLREARLVAGLEHPNILPVYDVGEDGGLPFLVMPLVSGGTLLTRMRRGKPEPLTVADWTRQLANALDTAHQAGILHRDIKPHNVLLGKDDRMLLADFGIAKMADSTRLTNTGAVVGTPIYMSPEIAQGKEATRASDLYALAVLVFELLTGAPPFDGDSPLAVMNLHVHGAIPRATERDSLLPKAVDAVFEWCLAKDPSRRPASCAEFAQALEEAVTLLEAAPPKAVGAPAVGPVSALVLGIDLGTTNSCVAVYEKDGPKVLANREGSRTTPSVVAFTDRAERFVGLAARRQALTNPRHTIHAAKRLIGRKFDDPEVKKAQEVLQYRLVAGENGDVKIDVDGRSVSPEEIAALILAEVRACAEEALGTPVQQAVVTVPAYFNDAQRQATRDAGQIAGLDVIRILNEPTAAAVAYGLDRRRKAKQVAVFDLGGGTFDVSILELNNGVFEVRSTAGDTFLGGEDFDVAVLEWLLTGFQKETGKDLRADPIAMQRLKEASEAAKCELSFAQETSIKLPFLTTDDEGPKHLERSLTRGKLEELVANLVQRTEAPCQEALEAAGLRPDQVDEVLLVGGQTRMPMVQRHVARIFSKEACREINPDEVVAMGAAVQGAVLRGDVKDVLLLDVTPLSLGVETLGGMATRLIEKNSTIPTRSAEIFTTVSEGQESVEIHVLQGEDSRAKNNKSLGRFTLVGIPPAPKAKPQIEVTFAIDSSGIVNVTARDMATGKSQGIQVNPAGGLKPAEVEKLSHRLADERTQQEAAEELTKLRGQISGRVETSRRSLAKMRDGLGKTRAQRIEKLLSQAETAAEGSEKTAMEEALRGLEEAAQDLTSVVLSRSKTKESRA